MPVSKPKTGSSFDIELPVLNSQVPPFQPLPPERLPFSSPVSGVNPIGVVDGIEPPSPAYFPPTNDIPPIPSVDAGLLEYTRLHGHSETPLSARQMEDDRPSVHASEAPSHVESLPAYRADGPPSYHHRRRDPSEPTTWPTVCFRIGFLFPFFWLCGALTLVTPRGSLDRIFMPLFKDFAPSIDSWHNTLQTEAEKEEYLARVLVAERRWAKMCLFAFSLVLSFIIVVAVVIVAVTRVH